MRDELAKQGAENSELTNKLDRVNYIIQSVLIYSFLPTLLFDRNDDLMLLLCIRKFMH